MHLNKQGDSAGNLNMALKHWITCDNCRSKLNLLVSGLIADGEDELTCSEAQNEFPNLAQDLEDGLLARNDWHSVVAHISICSSCLQAWWMFNSLLGSSENVADDWVPTVAKPDLSFLRVDNSQSQAESNLRWHLNKAGEIILELADQFLDGFAAGMPAYSGVKSGDTASIETNTIIKSDGSQLTKEESIVVLVRVVREMEADSCRLIVAVDIPSRGGWPNLKGISVSLIQRQVDQPTSSSVTDAYGRATFAGVKISKLAAYQIMISM